MSRRTDRGRRGFTLVEVLASFALVAAILPAAMGAVVLAMRLEESARRGCEAVLLAQSKLAELTATNEWQDTKSSGDFGDEWPDYKWEKEVTPWDVDGVSQMTLTVRWTSRGQERSVAVTTLVYSGSGTGTGSG